MAEKEWSKMKPAEIEKLVVDLSKKGNSPEKIGLILRDEHGIPKAKLLGKKIGQILRENNIDANSEHKNTIKKVERLKEHFKENKHDYSAQRSVIRNAAKIRKIEKLSNN